MQEFYGGIFNEKNRVIAIRQKRFKFDCTVTLSLHPQKKFDFSPLSKLEKMWSSLKFAIEDPFDLDHNLGGGLTLKSMCLLIVIKYINFVPPSLFWQKSSFL